MQEIIDNQSARISKLNATIAELNFTKENDIKNAKYEVEDKFYEQWKQMNGKFIKRFIAEMIQTGELNFSFQDNWVDRFTMTIDMDGNELASYIK